MESPHHRPEPSAEVDEPRSDDDALAPLRAAVAALDDTAPADRPAAFEAVNARLVAALRAVDDG